MRRRALAVETLHPYDIWGPISQAPPEIPFEQSVDWISDGLAPLGNSYVEVLRRGCLEQRWVDRALNQGKSRATISAMALDAVNTTTAISPSKIAIQNMAAKTRVG